MKNKRYDRWLKRFPYVEKVSYIERVPCKRVGPFLMLYERNDAEILPKPEDAELLITRYCRELFIKHPSGSVSTIKFEPLRCGKLKGQPNAPSFML